MIKKKVLDPNRVRCIERGFSFIPHRFLTEGFLASLSQTEILLYLFLVLVSDRHGLSFYSYDAICSLLQLSVDGYMLARDGLIEKDLIAFDGTLFQVLDLPAKPTADIRRVVHQDQPKVRHRMGQTRQGDGRG
jgi:Helix-turn-helix domain